MSRTLRSAILLPRARCRNVTSCVLLIHWTSSYLKSPPMYGADLQESGAIAMTIVGISAKYLLKNSEELSEVRENAPIGLPLDH